MPNVMAPYNKAYNRDFAGVEVRRSWPERPRARKVDDPSKYRDEGCVIAPACLACPLSECIHDWPRDGGVKHRDLAIRARVWQLGVRDAAAIAAYLDISLREGFRWQAKLNKTESYEDFLKGRLRR